MVVRPLLSAVPLALLGCAAAQTGGDAAPTRAELPAIERLEPSSGRAGDAYPITLRIVGGPFDTEGNTVRFGPATIPDVPSPDGRSLELALPKSVRTAPEVPPMVLPPGAYDVVVETAAGASPPRTFVLTAG